MSRMLPLTHTLLVIGDRSGLTAYDLSTGDVIRRVLFGKYINIYIAQTNGRDHAMWDTDSCYTGAFH